MIERLNSDGEVGRDVANETGEQAKVGKGKAGRWRVAPLVVIRVITPGTRLLHTSSLQPPPSPLREGSSTVKGKQRGETGGKGVEGQTERGFIYNVIIKSQTQAEVV